MHLITVIRHVNAETRLIYKLGFIRVVNYVLITIHFFVNAFTASLGL